MNTTIKHLSSALFLTLFVTACNSSASSDAKKVDIKKVEVKKVEMKPETTTTATTESTPTTEVKKDNATMSISTNFVEGQHYVRINPPLQTDAAPGKVEVAELFWLGCPHCYALEPEILKYKASHPDYVEFKQIPAMLNPSWAADANTFYIADILDPKGSKGLVPKLFEAIHKEKRRLRAPKAVARFFIENGYTEEQVESVKTSMAFKAKLARAQSFGQASQADSVPTLVVNGKYRTSSHMAGGNQRVMEVVKMLAQKEAGK